MIGNGASSSSPSATFTLDVQRGIEAGLLAGARTVCMSGQGSWRANGMDVGGPRGTPCSWGEGNISAQRTPAA
jgi:hypothetical protein